VKEERLSVQLHRPTGRYSARQQLNRNRVSCPTTNLLDLGDTTSPRLQSIGSPLTKRLRNSAGQFAIATAGYHTPAGSRSATLSSLGPAVGCQCGSFPSVHHGRHGLATHPLDPEPRRAKWEGSQSIAIGNNVWLGGGVIVCPGVRIGDNTVVGATCPPECSPWATRPESSANFESSVEEDICHRDHRGHREETDPRDSLTRLKPRLKMVDSF